MPDISCDQFRSLIAHFDALDEQSKPPADISREQWVEHFHACEACQDHVLADRVRRLGIDPTAFPCVHMAYRATATCDMHPDRSECPDLVIDYDQKFDEFAIIKHDVRLVISYCPWCGTKLPPSRRDAWFDAMEALGIDPWMSPDSIPEPYRTDAWFKPARTPGQS